MPMPALCCRLLDNVSNIRTTLHNFLHLELKCCPVCPNSLFLYLTILKMKRSLRRTKIKIINPVKMVVKCMQIHTI